MKCVAVCQDDFVVKTLHQALAPALQVKFVVEDRALARRLHDAGIPLTDIPAALWRHMPGLHLRYMEAQGVSQAVAGVAGLQAIATARRLGAVVSATDVRPATKEQVESLGASFVAVQDEEFQQAQTAGGYAKEMSDAYKEKQAALDAWERKLRALLFGERAEVVELSR